MRHVPGDFGFIVQSNPKRQTHRRAPATMCSLRQPYDPTLFNFNNVKPAEVRKVPNINYVYFFGSQILFELCPLSDEGQGKEVGHLVEVNVSPITHAHALLVPEPSSCLNQVTKLTQQLPKPGN